MEPLAESKLSRRELFATALMVATSRASDAQTPAPVLPFIALDHVALKVADPRRSLQFYMMLFGPDASRDSNRQANPGSAPGELFFLRLGDGHLSLSAFAAGERPGIDHFCLSVADFSKGTAIARLWPFEQPWPEWPSNNVWLRDPDGHIVQRAPSANSPRLPGIVRNAIPLAQGERASSEPAFRPLDVVRLSLVSESREAAAAFYARLLARRAGRGVAFLVGPSTIALGQSPEVESFRIAVAAFEPRSAVRTLGSRGVKSDVAPDGSHVWCQDPDGIRVEIGSAEA